MLFKPFVRFMSNLAIIPARGGSKRIPRKNIRLFNGKPIIAYVIETVLQTGLFDEVMVSTEDDEIAAIALEYGASVPFRRSAEHAGDHATTLEVINEVIAAYEAKGTTFDRVCCVYPTAVLATAAQLKQGLDLLLERDFDSVFPVVAYGHPVWRGFSVNNDQPALLWPENRHTRTQDLTPVYHDAGQWYWLQTGKIKDSIFTAASGTIILDELAAQDIDSPEDWQLAELKYKLRFD
jgi:pseudaminic acid cytidylyltransferase